MRVKFIFVLATSSFPSLFGWAATLNDAVVTAQKKEQLLEDVPISMQVVDEKNEKESLYFSNTLEKDNLFSGAYFGESPISSILFVRGIGTPPGIGLEQSVATFFDEVYYGRSAQSLLPLFDLERIELLSGPQPIFFGQNAIAGAVSYTSIKPQQASTGYAQLSFGTDGEYLQEFAYGGGVSDSLALRFAAHHSQADGYLDNAFFNNSHPEKDTEGYRLTGLWEPSSAASIEFKIESNEVERDGAFFQLQGCTPNLLTPCAIASSDPNINADFGQLGDTPSDAIYTGGLLPAPTTLQTLNFRGELITINTQDLSDLQHIFNNESLEMDSANSYLNFQYKWPAFKFTSISAYTEFDYDNWIDVDETPYAILQSNIAEDYEQISQEIRLESTGINQTFDWMLGLYYQKSDTTLNNSIFSAIDTDDPELSLLNGASRNSIYEESTWQSVFGSIVYHINDEFSVDVGGRYSEVEKEAKNQSFHSELDVNDNRIPNFTSSIQNMKTNFQDNSFDPSVSFIWDSTEDLMIYAKYVEGFKSGGFGGVDPFNSRSEFDSETTQSYEVGMKGSFFSGLMDLNVSAFDTRYSDLQVSAIDNNATNFLVNNAADASSKGLEIQSVFYVSQRLRLGASAYLLQAEYDDFPGAQCNLDEVNQGLCDAVGARNRKGQDLLYSPEWELGFHSFYSQPIGLNLNLSWLLDIHYKDDYITSLRYEDEAVQDKHEIVNTKISLSPFTSRWQVALYGQNVTDQRVQDEFATAILNLGSNTVSHTRGAHYGVNFRWNFY